MGITKKDVEYVANLSRVELSESEKELFTGQLGNVLGYMDKLNEADTEGVEPMSQSLSLKNIFRSDKRGETLGVAGALANAPARNDDSFCVPPVIEG